jgi:hypothetical protein
MEQAKSRCPIWVCAFEDGDHVGKDADSVAVFSDGF